jgi:hypothetical protein
MKNISYIGEIGYRLLALGVLALSVLSCADRAKLNPFDPTGQLNLNLSITSRDQEVRLSWDQPNLDGYSGFTIHRRQDGVDSTYKIIATDIRPEYRQYIDHDATYQQRYSYYLTVVSAGIESKPSNTVSIVPGPGEVWIVDKWGFQVVHTTYDVEHVIASYYTNWPPTDMAIAEDFQRGLILYNDAGMMEGIDLISMQPLLRITTVGHPFGSAYDKAIGAFWVIDSSGFLYRIHASTFQVAAFSLILDKPTRISVSEQAGRISLVDQKLKKIIYFDHNGNYISEISSVQNRSLILPERYAESRDLLQFWLIDDGGEWDRIYTRNINNEDFQCIDSLPAAGDISPAANNTLSWVVNYDDIDSSVLQLSASGTRQIELRGFYNPYDLEINRYDGTLLIADSGNRRVVHYNDHHQILGTNFNLNFPVRVIVE